MPELFIEFFSEEIPARLQARGADELARLVREVFTALSPSALQPFFGPRRIALAAEIEAAVPAATSTERGPRVTAPEQALAGFLRKHGVVREALRQDGDFWVLDKTSPGVDAATLVAGAMPGLLRRFAWPKSMRWGGTSAFTWIRPLRRIVCLLDGHVVPFSLATEGDDGHGLAAGDLTEGHRVHAPGPFAVSGLASWQDSLRARCVVADPAECARLIRGGIEALAAARGLTVVEDAGLLDEVAGLVEWPVALLGRIDEAFMDLPPEVMQVSMRVNQRYFALRDAAGRPAPWFAFAANIAAEDNGAAIIAGNERVLRARFSDARHFWDLDRRTRLEDRVAALDGVTFHAALGSQGDRVRRLVRLAGIIALMVGADVALAERAALLCKADLTTGMVGEFPELQGVMGGYYAAYDGEDARVAEAMRDHYAPKGGGEDAPRASVSVAVALADRIDQLSGFFALGYKPSGSGDPFALRRAALGIIRIIRVNTLAIQLRPVLAQAAEAFSDAPELLANSVFEFIYERLRIQVKSEGSRSDVLAAIRAVREDDDLISALRQMGELTTFLATPDGTNLLALYKRAANILEIEDRRDGPHVGSVDPTLFVADAERELNASWNNVVRRHLATDIPEGASLAGVLTVLAELRKPADDFFENVKVNDDSLDLRRNRLRLLFNVRHLIDRIADFSLIDTS